MKRVIVGMIVWLTCTLVQAKGVDFSLNAVPLPQALQMIYGQVFEQPFMLDPALAEDKRLVTFHIMPGNDERAFILRYLRNMHIAVSSRQGVDYLNSFTPPEPTVPQTFFIYRPRYRPVGYLTEMLSGQFAGRFNAKGGAPSGEITTTVVKAGSASDFVNRSGDVLVYYGTAADIARLKTLLPLTDTAPEEVTVAAYVFEVQTRERNGSGLALAAKLLSGKLNIQVGQAGGFDNFIRINTDSLDALYELFRTDSRFHVVSSPRLRVKNGAQAAFSVGADVPVLGKVSYADNRSVQSVEYRSSGVILQVTPQILADVVELTIDQQLSDFVETDTGVNNSPTLTKRQVKTQVAVSDGDIILLGGLAESKLSSAKTGLSFLPKGWLTGASDEQNKTDLLVVLQVMKVNR